jgi:DNA-binding response OmpR family regulator
MSINMNNKLKILIIEDDEIISDIYEKAFSIEYQSVICRNELEFYPALEKNNFDLFLIDLSLGKGKDGITLIHELRQMNEYATTPIFVVTAYTLLKDEEAAFNAGANAFFKKPVDYEVLLKEINKYLRK